MGEIIGTTLMTVSMAWLMIFPFVRLFAGGDKEALKWFDWGVNSSILASIYYILKSRLFRLGIYGVIAGIAILMLTLE